MKYLELLSILKYVFISLLTSLKLMVGKKNTQKKLTLKRLKSFLARRDNERRQYNILVASFYKFIEKMKLHGMAITEQVNPFLSSFTLF